jgi:hypothetical protein
MNASSVFLLLVVLACPLMMMWMMRGHGHGSRGHEHSARNTGDGTQTQLMHERSTTGLRELRDEIDGLIEEREQAERERAELEPPVVTGR